jgi:hypothetical protein
LLLGISPIKELINTAKNDVIEKKWESLLKELKEIENKKKIG